MTLTRHGHHIPESELSDEEWVLPERCGGVTACEVCMFEVKWRKDFAEKKAIVFPSEVESLDSVILKKIAAKIREKHTEPSPRMLIPDYQAAQAIYALADALDGVAKDLSGS